MYLPKVLPFVPRPEIKCLLRLTSTSPLSCLMCNRMSLKWHDRQQVSWYRQRHQHARRMRCRDFFGKARTETSGKFSKYNFFVPNPRGNFGPQIFIPRTRGLRIKQEFTPRRVTHAEHTQQRKLQKPSVDLRLSAREPQAIARSAHNGILVGPRPDQRDPSRGPAVNAQLALLTVAIAYCLPCHP